MADTKISDLTAAGALTGAEIVPVVQGGATVRTTLADIAAANNWTLIASATPVGVASVEFNDIPGTYSSLSIEYDGIQHGAAAQSLNIELSADGTNWSTAVAILGTAGTSTAFVGQSYIPRYDGEAHIVLSHLGALANLAVATAGSFIRIIRVDAGVADIRISWASGGNFTGGTIRLLGV
jgi:hypothetical protein